jgi:hypothetical protein
MSMRPRSQARREYQYEWSGLIKATLLNAGASGIHHSCFHTDVDMSHCMSSSRFQSMQFEFVGSLHCSQHHVCSSSQLGRKGPFHIRMIRLLNLVRRCFLIAQTKMYALEKRHITAKDGYTGVRTEKAS